MPQAPSAFARSSLASLEEITKRLEGYAEGVRALLGSGPAVPGIVGLVTEVLPDPAALAAHLAHQSMLLVLDNCEHLLDECAAFADLVLDTAPAARILTTTREPLGNDGESVVPLLSLSDDAPDLFVARASR